jgi:hypothetical protein
VIAISARLDIIERNRTTAERLIEDYEAAKA